MATVYRRWASCVAVSNSRISRASGRFCERGLMARSRMIGTATPSTTRINTGCRTTGILGQGQLQAKGAEYGFGTRQESKMNLSTSGAINEHGDVPEPPPELAIAWDDIPANVKIHDPTVLEVKEDVDDAFEYVIPTVKKLMIHEFTENFELKPTDEFKKLHKLVFGTEVRPDLLHRVVTWQLANRRQGTKKVKTRGEVRGTTKKPHAQKGSGRARQGDKRVPQMRGGGRAHGPNNPDFSFKLRKRLRRKAMRSMLTARFIEGNIFLVQDLKVPPVQNSTTDAQASETLQQEGEGSNEENSEQETIRWKTKYIASILETQGWKQKEGLGIIDSNDFHESLLLSTRNLENVKFFTPKAANVYDLLKCQKIIISMDGLREIQEHLDENLRREIRNAKRRAL